MSSPRLRTPRRDSRSTSTVWVGLWGTIENFLASRMGLYLFVFARK